MTTKNLEGKTRPKTDPYQVYVAPGGWVYRVLRHYQTPEKEAVNEYARVFCFVTSPFCIDGELGDVYLNTDIKQHARLIEVDGVPYVPPPVTDAPIPGHVYALTGARSIQAGNSWAQSEVHDAL
jgi:hypothetical protein